MDNSLFQGKVIDENQNPVPFANVVFTNTSIGTTTDFNGFFELEAPTVQKKKSKCCYWAMGLGLLN